MIRADGSAQHFPITYGPSLAGADVEIDFYCTDANVVISRKISGTFDSTTFDATEGSYNRGWLIIDYVD